MNQNEYFINKDDKNNNYNINIEQKISKERKSNIKQIKDISFTESEFTQGESSSINKDSFIKGLGLVFVYFSIIIYSLLYMLTPERSANLIFEGDINSYSYNYSLYNYNNNNKIYKLDSIRIRRNKTILKISKNFRYVNNDDNKEKLSIELIYLENQKIINKIIITNNFISKEINKDIKIYHYYKLNDFPFWLALFNKDYEDKINITSDYLNILSFDI